ncbi:discoidin domain-containing protein [Polaribacter haliotis]|uniref:Discoidin domain-containing protein n=1 Tax=Polaribacter haliotis TaxID=1888915 RepID=A0A7L8ACP7_9FLAO|nr:chondroitinase-B domain-containing protein [Polaribacter haliotis]QOD59761.1 discoidin domain-containing protein [Polaribacter haliotis]
MSLNKGFSQTTVNNQTELNNAISSASAGTTIILANGVWNNLQIDINKTATSTNPITIKAQSAGQVFIEGNSNVQLGGSYIFFEGFVFQNPSNLISISSGSKTIINAIIEFRSSSNNNCNNCRVTNIKIDSYNGTSAQETDTFKWILVHGQNNEISHSSFIGKNGVGSIINHNRSNDILDKTKIHHNYFADRIPVNNNVTGLNDQDAIRLGTSSTSLSDSFSEVYDNLFNNWAGEVEIISNKSGKNKYYNNTFRDYQGTLTLRHGNGCDVFNNYFFANENLFSGGVRVIGEDHKVYNNYFEGLRYRKPSGSGSNTTGALNITNGTPSSALSGYYQPKNIQIVNNTLVNCDLGIRIGTVQNSSTTLAPENITVANNIILDADISAFQEVSEPTGSSVYQANITQNSTWDLTNGTNNNQTVSSGLLEAGTDFYRIVSGSPAINAAIGSYAYLTNDILGGNRTTNYDAGAEEFGANGNNLPYKVADVGVKVGFLSSASRLSLSTNTINFNIDTGSVNFDINSNINWTISDDATWLTLNPTNGNNSATITATVLENTSGVERTATITVSETGGNLLETIIVTQSMANFNPNDAVAISGITVTGVGTQDPNIPENTLDNDTDTRWSANSTNGAAYLTYNLGCKRTVTNVKIYFHKGDVRTSSFKIAISDDGTNFTEVTNLLTSSGNTVGFENFNLPNNTETKFVRILGFGNSEGSGWNSYEEVQIFGEETCPSLSISNSLFTKGITVFPIPANKGIINIKSENATIGLVEVFDMTGKQLLKQHFNSQTSQLNIDALSKGIYFIKIQESFGRFIVN